MLAQIIAAIVGTVGFSAIYNVPARYYTYCGFVGGAGWAVYILAEEVLGDGVSIMLASMVVLFLSRLIAVMKKCPANIFLIAGIFPLVPGVGVYQTAYYAAVGELSEAASTGYMAMKNAVAIVVGIALVFEIPQKFFLTAGNLFERYSVSGRRWLAGKIGKSAGK